MKVNGDPSRPEDSQLTFSSSCCYSTLSFWENLFSILSPIERQSSVSNTIIYSATFHSFLCTVVSNHRQKKKQALNSVWLAVSCFMGLLLQQLHKLDIREVYMIHPNPKISSHTRDILVVSHTDEASLLWQANFNCPLSYGASLLQQDHLHCTRLPGNCTARCPLYFLLVLPGNHSFYSQ